MAPQRVKDVRPSDSGYMAASGEAALHVGRSSTRIAAITALAGLVFVALVLAGSISALWPSLALMVAVFIVLAGLVLRAPVYGVLIAILLFGFEATVKMRFTVEAVPSAVELAAALIDVAFVAALTVLLLHDRGSQLRRVWTNLGRPGRVLVSLIAAWLGVSLIQSAQSGDLVDGLQGYRLTQIYVAAALGGILLFASRPREDLVGKPRHDLVATALLAVLAAISGYAALRAIIGPAGTERAFVLSRSGQADFVDVFRTVGSLSSPVALASFLVPAGVFALILACLRREHRVLGGVVFACAMGGIIASYVRVGFIAVAAGALFLLAMLLLGQGASRQSKLVALGLIAAIVGGGYAAIVAAGTADQLAGERAEGLRDPLNDVSIQTRFDTWERTVEDIIDEPLGSGVGTVGHATAKGQTDVYTDNSYLKVIREQGIPVGLVFICGTLGLCWVVARRLARAGPSNRPLGVAALGGFVAFLVLCLIGEYIEQPGKVLAWTLFGVALWDAFGRNDSTNGTDESARANDLGSARLSRV